MRQLLCAFLMSACCHTWAEVRVIDHEEAPAALQRILFKQDLRPSHLSGGAPATNDVAFRSEVRLVDLAVAVQDRKRRPSMGLTARDFVIEEDGVRQKVTKVGSEELPFNLVILLDWSLSTETSRASMQEMARRFVGVAREHDKLALHLMTHSQLHVLSSLTSDRGSLLAAIEDAPAESGGTPLYDVLTLSYADELHDRRGERNALIIVSDGEDNQLWPAGKGSVVPFEHLRNAVDHMNALVYSIALDPVDQIRSKGAPSSRPTDPGGPSLRRFVQLQLPDYASFQSSEARRNLKELAERSGGRIFTARSISRLEPVYSQIAEELRSVYTVAYIPSNQNFDGAWRKIKVQVNRRGANPRTRSGYYAH